MNLHQLFTEFKTESDFHNYLIARRWPDGIRCPKCSRQKICIRRNSLRFSCKPCAYSFSATAGTIFHATRLPMSKWFLAISVILSAKKGISSLQLSRTIGVNKNTAWYMQMRLRIAMKEDLTFGGIIDPHDTEFSNLENSRQRRIWIPARNRMIYKSPGLKQIKENRTVVLKAIRFPRVKEPHVIRVETRSNKPDSFIGKFGGNCSLEIVADQQPSLKTEGTKPRFGRYYLARIEGFYTTLKRAIVGQYHQINPEYLGPYLSECDFKYSYSKGDMFSLLVTRCVT